MAYPKEKCITKLSSERTEIQTNCYRRNQECCPRVNNFPSAKKKKKKRLVSDSFMGKFNQSQVTGERFQILFMSQAKHQFQF
jgi:hypothetical protein